ncbi:non-ribosomal peptide synthetase [Cohnella sp. WQ 127256]|uniref:amino acid adenylation domain-containing protein n=1 Tax=Cohnella sp. WQ 127256 TaxID=2938790 RepID=UPI0021180BD2
MKKQYNNLNEAFEWACRSDKGIIFVDKNRDQRVSYYQLYEESLYILNHLQRKGMKAGDLLLLQIEEPRCFLLVFWACLQGGIIPVPITVGSTPEHRMKVRRIWELSDHPYLIASPELRLSFDEPIEQGGGDPLAVKFNERLWDTDSIMTNYSAKGIIHSSQADDIAFLQFSSGSTGDPKGVILTHRNLLTNIDAILTCSNAVPSDRSLSWMPLTHDMGLIGFHLAPLVAQMDQWIMQPRLFLMRPHLWLSKAHEYQVTQISSPNFGYKHVLNHLTPEDNYNWDLSSIKFIFNGAEPISVHLANEFLTRMEPYGLSRNAMFPVYGMAEASLAVTFPPIEEELQAVYVERSTIGVGTAVVYSEADRSTSVAFVDVGFPVSHCQVRICDDANQPQAEHVIGHIQIKGDNVTRGYYRNEDATQRLISEDGWLQTGDIGFMRGGRLVITGRKKDIIFVHGRNYFPHDLEQSALEVDGIEFGKIAICGVTNDGLGTDEIVAFLQHRGKDDSFASIAWELRRHLSRSSGLNIACVIPIKQIPKTTSGKPQRYKLVEQYTKGEFQDRIEQFRSIMNSRSDSSLELPHDEVEHKLAELWASIMGSKVGMSDSFYDYGGDSLKAALLLSSIHKHFQVDIPTNVFHENATIRAIAEYIRHSEVTPYNPIVRAEAAAHDPVSPTQRRMYLQEQFIGAGTAYNMPFALKLEGKVDEIRLEQALQLVVSRHDALRTSFAMIEGEVRQIIHPNEHVPMEQLTADEENLPELLTKLNLSFNLHNLPLIRSTLILVHSHMNYHILHLDIHHICSDGISANLLWNELFQLYQGIELPQPSLQYRDYAVWLTTSSGLEEKQSLEGYWSERLYSELPVLDLPTDFKRPERKSFDGDTIRIQVPHHLSSRVQNWIQEEKVSLYSFLLSAYSLLLNKYARQDDVIIGALVAGRNHADLISVMGAFINYIPIRFQVDANASWSGYIRNAQQAIIQDFEHQQLPFEEIVSLTKCTTSPSRNPLFDTMVILHNQMDFAKTLVLQDLSVAHYPLPSVTAKLDIKLDVYLLGSSEWELVWEFNTNLFHKSTIECFNAHFLRLLELVIDQPDMRLDDIELLRAEEQKRLLLEFNPIAKPSTDNCLVHQWVEKQAEVRADQRAVIFDESDLSYGELNSKANQLARVLRERGVKPDSIVPISVVRSPVMIVGILAILKAGGAYLPIAPEIPVERIRYMLEDSGAKLLLVNDGGLDDLPFDGSRIRLDDEGLYRGDPTNLNTMMEPNHLAYVIYTSGSTGNPKGVMIEHRSVINRIEWMQNAYPLHAQDVIMQKTAFTFDVSVWELFWWAQSGAAVHFLIPGGEKEPQAIVKAIERNRVTTMHFVPSMLHLFLAYIEGNPEQIEALRSLHYVFASGEALPVGQVNRFNALLHDHLGTKLINLYGPTEATVDVSYFDCSMGEALSSIPIGKPIDNTQLYVVDKHRRLLPPGIPGELCIGGIGLARGYLNRPELTEEKFVENPFVPGALMYRTGDLAKQRLDGNLEYLGRLDHQVKVRGYRMELGEIEHHLLQHEAIQEAVVITKSVEDGNTELYAYLVVGQPLNAAEFRSFLIKRLPEYMVPAYFVKIERMPLSSSGKADRKALSNLYTEIMLSKPFMPPQSPMQIALAEIWEEILQANDIGIDHDFFELGGHSLKAAQLVHSVQQKLKIELTLREIFSFPTIKELAMFMENKTESVLAPIVETASRAYYPLSSAQSRLYILNKFEGIETTYHLPVAFLSEGVIDPIRFEQTIQALIARHESLRTTFELVDGIPMQKIHDQVTFQLETFEGYEASLHGSYKKFSRPFELDHAPLLRAGLRELPDEKQLILLDMHHLVSDGLSMGVLVRDFVELYEGRPLPELQVQVKDYIAWQTIQLASQPLQNQRQYWQEVFADGVPLLELPTDFKRPLVKSYVGSLIPFDLNAEQTLQLKQLANESKTTLYMVMLALFNVLLAKYSSQEDIVVGSPVSGRPHADLRNLIGMFVNTIPLRNYPAADKSFMVFLQELKENVLTVFENQDYPFEELVGDLQVSRDLSRNPLFDVMFVMQNMDIPELRINQISMKRLALPHSQAKFDLTLEVFEQEGGLTCNFEYCTELFATETVERLIKHFQAIISSILTDSYISIGEIEMMSPQERHQIIHEFNDTACDYPQDETLHQWLENQVNRQPEQIALIFGDTQLTYFDLNAKANQLAHVLREKGLGQNRIAAVIAERSPEMMIALLAIVKAGGAYLPIAPDYPVDRISYMLKDSGALILLAQERGLTPSAPQIEFAGTIINLDDSSMYEGDPANLTLEVSPRDMAYMIYTSGSTGNPKGVMVEHSAIVNRLYWMQKQYAIGPGDVILHKTAFTFDVSVWELFWWSLAGATVCFLEPGGEKDPEKIVQAIGRHNVTTMHFVPSMLHLFLDYLERQPDLESIGTAGMASLKQVFASGEALPIQQVKRFYELIQSRMEGGAKLINLYGPTEAAIDVSYYDCQSGEPAEVIPIGKPIDNIQLYIVNSQMHLQPIGLPGELCIAGVGLARGYMERPELTAEKFIPNPFVLGKRLYRTGDLARWLPDGNIEYRGRLDHQVKLRGYRIELGEIEAGLLQNKEIAEAVVLVKESLQGDKRLCAYLVSSHELDVTAIRQQLSRVLPEYMIPSSYTQVEAMPLTASGKANRAALAKLELSLHSNEDYVAPQNELEVKLAEIWRELLNVERVGIRENFFDIGGHSLLLLRMHAKLEGEFPGKAKVTDLFAYPTIEKLAEFFVTAGSGSNSEISLEYIEFPSEFFVSRQEQQAPGAAFKIQLDEAVSKDLIQAGNEITTGLEAILTALYAYLFAQLTQRSKNGIHIGLSDQRIYPIEVDLQQIPKTLSFAQTFAHYFASETQRIRDLGKGYDGKDILKKQLNPPEKCISALLYDPNHFAAHARLTETFDVIVSYRIENRQIVLYCDYNGRRLRKDKIKQLMQGYAKLARWFVSQYRSDKEVSTARDGETV